MSSPIEYMPDAAAWLEEVEAYTRRGWPVLPLHNPTGNPELPCSCRKHCPKPAKHPRTIHGHMNASADPAVVRKWHLEFPFANVGISLQESGLVVVGPDGPGWLDEFEKRGIPRCPTVETGGGKGHLHFYLRRPEGCAIHRSCKPGEYDILSNGYVVAPPSQHVSGRFYRWLVHPDEVDELPEAPAWVVDMLNAAAATETKIRRPRPSEEAIRRNGREDFSDLRFWSGRDAKRKPDGEIDRSATLHAIAYELAGVGCEVEEIEQELAERDEVLGYSKFAGRKDRDKQYRKSAVDAVQNVTPKPPRQRQAANGTGDVHEATAPPAPPEAERPTRPARISQATQLVELAIGSGIELFHDEDRAYATFRLKNHQETHPLKSMPCRRHLIDLYYETEERRAPGSQALQEALDTLEARAFRHGKPQPVSLRLAQRGSTIYLDLVNEEWEAVEITPAGWRVVKTPPVKFRRKTGMLSLPYPTRDGSIEPLWRFANVREESDRRLFVAALVAALRPRGPYPVLGLHGEPGAAKSTTARVFRALIDPNKADLRDSPTETRDLMIAATSSWMVCYDNLSGLPLWLSDALCRLSTGAGFGVRKNYTDDEEMLFVACRPIVLTGIGEAASRSDLLDRSILLPLQRLTEQECCDEETFWAEFEKERPAILGTLVTAVSAALKNLPETRLPGRPRMADFALWATAAESALGWKQGAFMEAYAGNRSAANSLALEASSIGDLVIAVAQAEKDWTGTASELLVLLEAHADERITKRKDWPKNARSLGSTLKTLAPNLRAVGVEVGFRVSGGRWIHIQFSGESAKESAKESANGHQQRFADS